MSENVDKKLKGMIEYLSIISDMMTRMKMVSDTYGVNPSKMNEDGTMDVILSETDPMVVGLLVTTMMKFKNLLDNPMENLQILDAQQLDEFKTSIDKIKEKIFEVDKTAD